MKGEAGCIVPVNSAQLLPNRLQHASTHQHLNLAVPALASLPLDLTDPGKHHHQTDVVFFRLKLRLLGRCTCSGSRDRGALPALIPHAS